MDDDAWVPRISCQACGQSWAIGERMMIQHDCLSLKFGDQLPLEPVERVRQAIEILEKLLVID